MGIIWYYGGMRVLKGYIWLSLGILENGVLFGYRYI